MAAQRTLCLLLCATMMLTLVQTRYLPTRAHGDRLDKLRELLRDRCEVQMSLLRRRIAMVETSQEQRQCLLLESEIEKNQPQQSQSQYLSNAIGGYRDAGGLLFKRDVSGIPLK